MTELNRYAADYTSSAAWTKVDIDNNPADDDNVWINESTKELFIGNLAAGDVVDVNAILTAKGITADTAKDYKVILNDDDGVTGKVKVNADVDRVIVDNDFNTAAAANTSGWAKADLEVSGQTDTLKIEIDMDSVMTKAGDGGTDLDLKSLGGNIEFSGKQNTAITTPGMVSVAGLNAHNLIDIDAAESNSITGSIEMANDFTLGESFAVPPVLLTSVGITLASVKGMRTVADGTAAKDAFVGTNVNGNAIASIVDGSGHVTGYYVRNNGMISTCDATGNKTSAAAVADTVCPPPVVRCDPDNTLTINAGAGKSIDMSGLSVSQVNTGYISGIGDVSSSDGKGLLVQNNVKLDGTGTITADMSKITQNINVGINYGSLKVTGGNLVQKNGTAASGANQTDRFYSADTTSISFGDWSGTKTVQQVAVPTRGPEVWHKLDDAEKQNYITVFDLIAAQWAADAAARAEANSTQMTSQQFVQALTDVVDASGNRVASDALIAASPALFTDLAGGAATVTRTQVIAANPHT